MAYTFTNYTKHSSIPSCYFTFEELKKLFEELHKKNEEAVKYQIEGLNQEDTNFETNKKIIIDNFKITINFTTKNGESVFISDKSELTESNIPQNIEQILIETSFFFRNNFQFEPRNRFEILLDFKRTDLGDMSNLSTTISNMSNFKIFGDKPTWVGGVYQYLSEFFNNIKAKRRFLFFRFAYDIFLYLIGLQIMFGLIYNLDKFIISKSLVSSKVFLIFFYLYLLFLFLMAIRFSFNIIKHLFPYLEFNSPKETRKNWGRVIISILFLGTISSLLAYFLVEIISFIH